ncbi:MAG: aldolase [Alphaproteobacteria bacterium]|nr:aldolase [Alphaproteobacteria bacterium]
MRTRDLIDDQELELRRDLAAAFRVSARLGLNHSIGNHFSLMLPGSDELYLLNPRGMLFQEITASSLIVVDYDGRLVRGEGEVRPVAFHIHAPIHKARADARCVLHLHPPHTTALSLLENGRLALAHHNNLIVNDRVAYDDAMTGPAGGLEEGARLAAALGDKTVMVMANHGILSVGPTVEDAFHEMLVVEWSCQHQLMAMWTGQKLRQQPDHLRWNYRGVWSDKLEGGELLNAWRRVLDKDEPDYRD